MGKITVDCLVYMLPLVLIAVFVAGMISSHITKKQMIKYLYKKLKDYDEQSKDSTKNQ